MDVRAPFRLQLRKILDCSGVVSEKVHAADAVILVEGVIDLGNHVVDTHVVGEPLHDVDRLRVVERKAGAIAGDSAGSRDRAARDQLAGMADGNVICQQIGNRIRNAIGTVARDRGAGWRRGGR